MKIDAEIQLREFLLLHVALRSQNMAWELDNISEAVPEMSHVQLAQALHRIAVRLASLGSAAQTVHDDCFGSSLSDTEGRHHVPQVRAPKLSGALERYTEQERHEADTLPFSEDRNRPMKSAHAWIPGILGDILRDVNWHSFPKLRQQIQAAYDIALEEIGRTHSAVDRQREARDLCIILQDLVDYADANGLSKTKQCLSVALNSARADLAASELKNVVVLFP